MQPTPQAQAFVDAINTAHGIPGLLRALQPALEHEADLRKTFAVARHNVASLHPMAGLVDLYAPDAAALHRTLARDVVDEKDLFAKHIMPLNGDTRRKTGEPSMAVSLKQFRDTWTIFSEGTLGQLGHGPWENMIVAGGSVLACLLPMPESVAKGNSKRAIRKWFHEDAVWATSDVDIFLYGLDSAEAEKKCIQVYEAVRDSVPWDVTCVRTKHAITIHSQFPYRSVQIVLRLYSSPAEVLAGFDVDCACVAFDGARVWASPRAAAALVRQANTIDVTRRSPSYEVRLAKYNTRGFEIAISDLRREDIDPTIYERALSRINGLARLLVLEKISSSDQRMQFLSARRNLRGMPSKSSQYIKKARKYKGDLKANTSGLDISSYESAMFHVPYGPKFDAARIEKIIYQNDLGLNSPFNPKNKKRPNLHRHPAFFGTMAECLEDCCECCPTPQDEEAEKLSKVEDETFIHGRVQFIEDDPGRQSVGSFKPLDAADWAIQAYIGPLAKLFNAIASHDFDRVKDICAGKPDLVSRDHVGRTALHLAIISDAPLELCALIIEAGARITSRLPDGRTPLMLAAQKGNTPLVECLLERSRRNEAQERAKNAARLAAKAPRSSSNDGTDGGDDDGQNSDESWSDIGDKKAEVEEASDGDFIDSEDGQPDIIDLAAVDWETNFNALLHSIASGSVNIIDLLFEAGADPTAPVKIESTREVLYPLTATLTIKDEEKATKIVRRLINAGAHVSAGDANDIPIFHHAVAAGNTNIVAKFLEYDTKIAKAMLDLPLPNTPLVLAIASNDLPMVALLLVHGAKCNFTEQDFDNALAAQQRNGSPSSTYARRGATWRGAIQSVEASLAAHNELYQILIPLGADVNVGIRSAYVYMWNARHRASLVEALRHSIQSIEKALNSMTVQFPTVPVHKESSGSWKNEFSRISQALLDARRVSEENLVPGSWAEQQAQKRKLLLPYLKGAEEYLNNHDALTWDQFTQDPAQKRQEDSDPKPEPLKQYRRYKGQEVGDYVLDGYDALFEAAWKGDDSCIVELCHPPPNHAHGSRRPLEVGVFVPQDNNTWSQAGFNVFTLACLAKRWDTARLIIAIAAAQWEQHVEQGNRGQGRYGYESDDSDSDSIASDQADCKPINLSDIAARVSEVRSSTSPSDLISASFDYPVDGATETFARLSILSKAVREKDLETFVSVLNILEAYVKNTDNLMPSLLTDILSSDFPPIFDEFIRRTGMGIEVSPDAAGRDENEPSARNVTRAYLGLNVHGKKRKDLARRSDPDAPRADGIPGIPVLWHALRYGAAEIAQWLNSPNAVSAYRFYAHSKATDRALRLRRVDLDQKLQGLLGFRASSHNESAVLAAILATKEITRALKVLFATYPDQTEHLHLATKHNKITPLLLLVSISGPTDALDLLLAHGADVEAVDARGYNVMHIVCDNGCFELFKLLLLRLPSEPLRNLLSQQSYSRHNTPLMIAIKRGRTSFVERLLQIGFDEVVNIPDVDMFPIHAATRLGYARILVLLLEYGANLTRENSLGDTPLDIALREDLKHRKSLMRKSVTVYNLNVYGNEALDPTPELPKETDIAQAQAFITSATRDHIQPSDSVVRELKVFLERFAKQDGHTEAVKETDCDTCDWKQTLNVLSNPVARTSVRTLVHLMDTQRSTARALALLHEDVKINVDKGQRDWHTEEDDHKEFRILESWNSLGYAGKLKDML